MYYVLQENLFSEIEYETFIRTLTQMGLPYSEHKVVPFTGELLPQEPIILGLKVICFGSYSMRHTAVKYRWKPGLYDLFDQNFLVQREHWGDRLLNSDSKVLPFKDVQLTEPTFIRPIDDSKYFAGKVFEVDEFMEWKERVVGLDDYGTSLTGKTLVQLCQPKTIYSEYRCWVVGGKIVTCSQYKVGSRVHYTECFDEPVLTYAQECVNIWQPHKAFVLDVCDTPEGFRIVEINTLNSAGFYAGNIGKLIMALEELENVDHR